MAITRFDHIKCNRIDVQETTVAGGTTIVQLATANLDEQVKVSSNDTTAGYLNGKLVAGTNITLTEGNDGGNEILTISGGGVPDKVVQNFSYSNATTTYSDIAVITGLAPNTKYMVYVGGYFDPSDGQHNWNFSITNGANSDLYYPNYWNGWMQSSAPALLPGGLVVVNTVIPAPYGMYMGGYGITWDSNYGGLTVGITFSYETTANANSQTIKWKGRRNGTSVGGSLNGYDCILIAKSINV